MTRRHITDSVQMERWKDLGTIMVKFWLDLVLKKHVTLLGIYVSFDHAFLPLSDFLWQFLKRRG